MNTATVFFYSAVEPDALIAFFSTFVIFFLRLPVTVEFSELFQAKL